MKKKNVEGDHHPPPRAFQEKISFSFVKDALGDALGESLKAKETSLSATFGSTASLN